MPSGRSRGSTGAPAREAIRSALSDRDEIVRRSAIYAAGLWRDGAALPPLLTAVQSTQPAVQRAAAEALGRIGDARAVPALVEASASASDRVLEHSLTYALIEIGNAATTASAGLKASAPRSRRATLIALDQIDGGQLTPEGIIPLLDSSDPVLKDTAWWIALRHPDWGAALAGFFETRVSAPVAGGAERDDLSQKLARFSGDPAVQALVARLAVSGTSTSAQLDRAPRDGGRCVHVGARRRRV